MSQNTDAQDDSVDRISRPPETCRHDKNTAREVTRRKTLRYAPVIACLSLVALAACQEVPTQESEAQGQTRISFARDVQPIFDANCVQCHAQEMPQADLVLEVGASYAMLVDTPSEQSPLSRVDPGAPDQSYILRKLKGTHVEAGGLGLGMPLTEGNFTPLPPDTLAVIESWISEGAGQD